MPTVAEISAVEKKTKNWIAAGFAKGAKVAASNLKRWLEGKGEKKEESSEWLLQTDAVNDAVEKNTERFFSELNSKNNLSLEIIASEMEDGETRTFSDEWVTQVSPDYPFGRIKSTDDEMFFAYGDSQLKTIATFNLVKINGVVIVTGTVMHIWTDIYDWELGLGGNLGAGALDGFNDEEMKLLEVFEGAKPFKAESRWSNSVSGTIESGLFGPISNYQIR